MFKEDTQFKLLCEECYQENIMLFEFKDFLVCEYCNRFLNANEYKSDTPPVDDTYEGTVKP